MNNRKSITKKLRFEVFKRDKFTCQYCGKEAPKVVLEIDYIKPVVKGGTNQINNLVTSCFDCNRGKGKRVLSDDSYIQKSKKSKEDLQEKRNQLAMMRDWIEEEENLGNEMWDIVLSYYFNKSGEEKTSYKSKKFKIDFIKLLKKEGVVKFIEAVDYVLDVLNQYCPPHETKNVIFWNKVYKRVLFSNMSFENNRNATFRYCMGIYKNKFKYFQDGETTIIKECVMESTLHDEEIKSIFKLMDTRINDMDGECYEKFLEQFKTNL